MAMCNLVSLVTLKILPLVWAIVGFGSLIAIHEFGHFFFCKVFGIHTPTFSIGFGPELFSKKIGATNFRLALIPLGGYCEIAGLAEVGQGTQEFAQATDPTAFGDRPYWQKLLVMLGGILFNLIFAYIVMCGIFMVGTSQEQALVVTDTVKDSAAEKGGLLAGDGIISINKKALLDDKGYLYDNASEIFLTEIKSHPEKSVHLDIIRKHEHEHLSIVLGTNQEHGTTIGSLGAYFAPPMTYKRLPFIQAIQAGITKTNYFIHQTAMVVKRLFTECSLEGTGGPLMIMSVSFKSAQNGIINLLVFLALISVNLALLNLLPIGALDGGQLLFVTIEAIIGRKLPDGLRNGINIASWVLFLLIAVFVTYRDIASLFGDTIGSIYHKLVSLITK